MTIRQLQVKAYNEWNSSHNIKQQYHTFEFYWWEKYARIYQLPSKIKSIGEFYH
jgi:hypothetical protein